MNWWVCEMKGGGYFIVECDEDPNGRYIDGGPGHVKVAANSYRVVYGPCSESEAREFVSDVEGQ